MSKETQKKIIANAQVSAFTLFLEHLDLTAIYVMFTHPVLHAFLEQIGKFFMFPFAAATNVVLGILSWRQYYLDRQTSSLVSALVQTATAVALSIAVIGALAAATIFSLATPIIFTATLALKTLFHAGAALYYLIKGALSDDPAEKSIHFAHATKQGITAGIGILVTTAVTCVFLLGKVALAGIGIAASALAAIYAVYLGVSLYRASRVIDAMPSSSDSEDDVENQKNNTKGLMLEFGMDGKQQNDSSDDLENAVPLQETHPLTEMLQQQIEVISSVPATMGPR